MWVTGSLAHGGAEHHSVTLANRLSERGHECHVAYVKPAGDQLARIKLRTPGTVSSLGAAGYLDPGAVRRFAERLAQLRPSVLVAANPYALLYATLARWQSRLCAPLVVTYHSTRWPGLKEQAKLLAYRPFMWSAHCAVFVCEYQRRYCMRRGLLARRNIVIHNGVDTECLRDDPSSGERRARRAAFGYTNQDYVIAMVAALRPEKNHLQMLEAVASLRALGVSAQALLVGDGGMREAVEHRARALGISRQLTVTGFREDVRPYLAACDVVAVCSSTEALSLSAIEAMAMGKPLIHSQVGGAAELIEHGRSGLLYAPGDTAALIACLLCSADPAVAVKLGAAARARVESQFCASRMVDRYERLLLELSEWRDRSVARTAGYPS